MWIWVNTVFFTHFPEDRICEVCKRTVQKTHWRSRTPCRKFGDLITADHKVLRENCESRNNHRYAVVVQDLATQWIQSCPCRTKTSQETQRSLQKFLEPDWKPKVIYTDKTLEFGKACGDLSCNHCTSTPHGSETNGTAERAVRRVNEGTSAVLLQSGLDKEWWADFMECYCYLRNIQDLLSDGKTPYERRFGMPLNGPVIPFGAMVEYHPISAKDYSRLHQFGAKVLPGKFLSCALYAGRNLERRHFGRRHSRFGGEGRIRNPRQKDQCKGSVNAAKKWKLHIPSRRCDSQNHRGEQRLRTSTFIQDSPDRGEEQVNLRGESGGLSSP